MSTSTPAASTVPATPSAAADPRAFVPTTLGLGDARLRPWSLQDLDSPTLLDGLLAAAADPQIALWNPLPTADHEAATKWLETRAKAWSAGTLATFALLEGDPDSTNNSDSTKASDSTASTNTNNTTTDAASPTLLGALTVRWTDRSDGLGMIGYWLLPAARGRGLATKATLAATDWAFRTADVRRLEVAHAVENEASCRVAQRCGFPAEGTLRASYRFGDGQYHDEHLHARLATDPGPGDSPRG
ncbi:GNAT family N-acetyltransferase [Streptomyces sp. NPDC021093]|uniref:GNAT family N-acetyltransferase n=1 Tax=Streptomyces sp. NPDC021093 TaxID=3365112 RepID=UPI0037B28960